MANVTTRPTGNLGYIPENVANKSLDVTTDGASDTKYPSVKATKTYVDDQIATVSSGGTATQGTYIVSGCQVTYSGTNLDYIITAGTFYIQGVLYTIAQSTVTLSAADGTYDRVDVIYADTSSTVGSITGTPAINPSEPSYNPTTQIPLRFVIVYANTLVPPDITTAVIYRENAGAPAEWNWSTSGTGINVNSTSNPYVGTKDIEATSMANNAYAKGVMSSGSVDLANYQQLVFYLRFKSAFVSSRVLKAQWFAASVAKGNALTVTQGQFGLDGTNTSTYQAVVIPALQFAVPTGTAIDELRFTDSGGAIGFYLDEISLTAESGASGGTSGITQAQADARYAQLAVSFPASSTGSAIARFNGTTGKIIESSSAILSDSGTINIPAGQTYNINGNPHTHTGQMMITVEGTLSVSTGSLRYYNQMGRTLTFSKAFIGVATAPTGAAIIVDIDKAGTTIFTNQANRPQIAAGANEGNTTTIGVSTLADGEYLTLDVDQVGSTVAGSNLTCVLTYS